MQSWKERAKTTLNKPTQIYASGVENVSNSIRANLPTEETIKRTLRRKRASNVPKTPNSLRELRIEGKIL